MATNDGMKGPPAKQVDRWTHEIEVAEKALKKFHDRGEKNLMKFLAMSNTGQDDYEDQSSTSLYNIFWANTHILQAALYANPPKPVVKREFLDMDDDVARVAGEIMQRMLKRGVQTPESDMHAAFLQSVQDYLIVGLGQIWMRYEVETQQVDDPEAGPYEQLLDEIACTDFVHWKDFLWSPARTWAEVRWVGRIVRLTQAKGTRRFGKIFSQVQLQNPDKQDNEIAPTEDAWKKGVVYEIWDKEERKVIWYAKGVNRLLDEKSDPLKLKGFFPCPKPLLSTNTTSNLIPRSDYIMVSSQYEELNELNTRIRMLEKACKVVGVYDKAQDGIQRMFNQAVENQLIPVDNWAAFAEKGGIKGVIDWVPIDIIASVIIQLQERKHDIINQIYELTGISDIMRGVSAPRETLGAQQLKSQYSSVRLQLKQGAVSQFVQEAMRIKGDIIASHFRPETIAKQSLIQYTDDARYAEPAIELLKNSWSYQYRLEIEVDSMSIPDYNAERQARVEYVTAVGQYMSQVWPMVEANPAVAPFFLRMLQWVSMGFRASSGIESVLDTAIKNVEVFLQQKAQEPPKPSPEEMKAKAEIEAIGAKTEADIKSQQMKTQSDVRSKQMKTQSDVAAQQMKTTADITTQQSKVQADMKASVAKALADIMIAQKKAEAAEELAENKED
jgi:hypothetical protein